MTPKIDRKYLYRQNFSLTCASTYRYPRQVSQIQGAMAMKLRTASESVGWMNSVGPLTVSPHFPKPSEGSTKDNSTGTDGKRAESPDAVRVKT